IYGNGVLTGRMLYIPGGNYVTTQPLYVRDNMILQGDGPGTQIALLSSVNTIDIATTALTWTTKAYNPVICLNGNGAAGPNTCQNDDYGLGATGAAGVYDVDVSTITKLPGILAISNNGACCTNTMFLRGVWAQGYNRLMMIRELGMSDEGGV